jgi:hypothetical protein
MAPPGHRPVRERLAQMPVVELFDPTTCDLPWLCSSWGLSFCGPYHREFIVAGVDIFCDWHGPPTGSGVEFDGRGNSATFRVAQRRHFFGPRYQGLSSSIGVRFRLAATDPHVGCGPHRTRATLAAAALPFLLRKRKSAGPKPRRSS